MLGVESFPQLFQFRNALTGAFQFVQTLLFLSGQLLRLLPQTLILAVPGQNVLLLADEVGGAEGLFGSVGVGDELVGEVLFLLGQLAGEGALVVDALDLHVPEMQLISDADDALGS